MWSGVWNKRKLTSEISNRFLASTVVRAPDWWSGGCEFKPHWGQFLTKLILLCVTSDLSAYLTEKRIVKNSIVIHGKTGSLIWCEHLSRKLCLWDTKPTMQDLLKLTFLAWRQNLFRKMFWCDDSFPHQLCKICVRPNFTQKAHMTCMAQTNHYILTINTTECLCRFSCMCQITLSSNQCQK